MPTTTHAIDCDLGLDCTCAVRDDDTMHTYHVVYWPKGSDTERETVLEARDEHQVRTWAYAEHGDDNPQIVLLD